MSYEVMNKTPRQADGQITETTIDIRQNDPYTLITRTIEGDHTKTTDKKAIELVLQMVNEETTPKAVMVENIKELKEQVKEQQETIQQALESNQLLSSAFEELTYMVLEEVLPKLEEESVITLDADELVGAMKIEDIAEPIGKRWADDEEVEE